MSEQTRDPKGDRRHGSSQQPTGHVNPSKLDPQDEAVHSLLPDAERELGRIMFSFSNFDHGYLKLRRSPLGADLHITWTWTLGPHSGSYVYVRVEFWRITYGLELLARKVFDVDEGKLRPSPDRRNSNYSKS
jgi:hypothetical protein